MINEKYDVLGQLLGCYFHQDWPEEFDDDMSALQTIAGSEPKEQLIEAVREIDALLMEALSEQELRAVLIEKIGCYFEPDSRGNTCNEWLLQVRDKFAQG